MKQKIYKILKKYQVIIISAIIFLAIGIFAFLIINLFFNDSSTKTINEEAYYLEYDNTWKLIEKNKYIISLKHNSESKVIIQIVDLNNEYEYSSIEELIDELIYNMNNQNKGFTLISNKKDKITKYNFDGYKLLYENDKEQVMINVYKKSDKLIIIRYEANNEYFDILLDSVHNIINNLDVKEQEFDLKNELSIKTEVVKYSKDEKIDAILGESANYKIANKNYLVEYSIPKEFDFASYDSTRGYYYLKLDDKNIELTVDISNKNMYEYLDKDKTVNLYKNYLLYQEKDYSEFEETISKLKSNYDSYIYKNSYYYNNAVKYDAKFKTQEYKRRDENVELIYALDNNHTLIIKLKATGVAITQKLINMININSSSNYASYIKVEKENSFLIAKLKRFADYNKNKLDIITLKVPDKYQELDKNENIYLKRFYGLDYNEDMNIYNYNMNYELSTLSYESIINTINLVYINSIYGESHNLIYKGNLTLNSKQFKVYDGGYTDISGIMFTNSNRKKYYVNKKVLFYEMPGKGCLYIEINGNGKEITDDILNELTNFVVEEKDL